jgi:hypothetical protein
MLGNQKIAGKYLPSPHSWQQQCLQPANWRLSSTVCRRGGVERLNYVLLSVPWDSDRTVSAILSCPFLNISFATSSSEPSDRVIVVLLVCREIFEGMYYTAMKNVSNKLCLSLQGWNLGVYGWGREMCCGHIRRQSPRGDKMNILN